MGDGNGYLVDNSPKPEYSFTKSQLSRRVISIPQGVICRFLCLVYHKRYYNNTGNQSKQIAYRIRALVWIPQKYCEAPRLYSRGLAASPWL